MTVHLSVQDFQPAPSADASGTSANVVMLNRRARTVSWQDEMVSTLCRFIDLPEGWDSYAGKPLRHDTGMFALQLMNGMMGPSIPSPHLVPISDGGVQIEWHQNGFDIELYVAAPYDCELMVHDHNSGETKCYQLKSDFDPLKRAIRDLIDYNRNLNQVANAG